jgi:trimethylamine:corrinoid methyltransferase-like protein
MKGMESAGRERAREILREHVPQPLERDVLKDGNAFVKKVAKGYSR